VKYIPFLGDSEKVSKVCLGTMTFGDRCDLAASKAIVAAAIDAGINFFDTAPMYSNGAAEEYLGQALAGRRDKAVIATKVHAGLDEATIIPSIEASLKRLRTDHVDLFLIHWPAVGMNLTNMMRALDNVVRSGKARYVGCCNFPAWLLASSNATAAEHGWPKLRCHQVAYNLIERGVEVEVLPQATTDGIFVTAYRPLAIGLLSGAFRQGKPLSEGRRGSTDSRVITWLSQHGGSIERFLKLCERKSLSPAQAAMAWVASSPAMSCPIAGASSPGHVRDAAASVDIALDDEGRREISELFDTEVKEEGLQLFPGLKYNYPRLRRTLFLAVKP
jgi:aryl-alcohol dehydrogenase-like predicted oxidoreductase